MPRVLQLRESVDTPMGFREHEGRQMEVGTEVSKYSLQISDRSTVSSSQNSATLPFCLARAAHMGTLATCVLQYERSLWEHISINLERKHEFSSDGKYATARVALSDTA